VRNQIVVLVDTHLVDAGALERELGQVVRAAHRNHPSWPATPVAVLPSCFAGPALADARDGVEAECQSRKLQECADGPPLLDSRVPVSLGRNGHAAGRRLTDRFGLRLHIAYDAVPSGPS
jgi:hypothetical protein